MAKNGDSRPEGAVENQWLPQLFENLPLLAYRIGLDGRILDCNKRVVETLGYEDKNELVGKPLITTIYAPSSQEKARTLFLKWKESGKLRDEELQIVTKQGDVLDVLLSVDTVRDTQGRPICSISTQLDITRRKRAEEEIRRERNRAQTYLDVAGVMIIAVDAEGRVILLNHRGCEILACSAQDAIGKNWVDNFIPPATRDEVKALSKSIMEGNFERVEYHENPILNSRGEERIIAWQNAPLKDAKGHIIGILSSGNDITERRRMDEELRRYSTRLEELVKERTASLSESEKKYRSLVENIPDVTWTTDQKGRTVFISPNVTRVYGYTPEEICEAGETVWLGRIHPDDLPHVQEAIDALFARSKVFDVEYRIQRKDGEWIWLHDRSVSAYEKGGMWYADGVFSDITERKQAEEELRATRERLELAVASNPAVIYTGKPLVDYSDWRLTYISDRVSSMLGHEPRDFIGHPEFWEGHIHPEDKRVFTAEIPKLWKEGHHSFEYRFLHKDGNYRWMHEEARVLRDSDGKPREVNGYWIDVTARKQMEEDLARAQRLATIGELAAMVGHDLRNPLTGIAGAAYYLKTKLSPKAAARTRQMLELIDDEIKHSDKIVSDLLEYSRELRLELTKTDARSITSHALSEARIPRRIRVVNSTRKKPQIEVDTDKMNRLLLNIIRNAVDAMPQGGTLRITSRESRGRIELSVADTGAGITEEDLRELWNPLFTTKAKGIGLGLPIANRLAEAHGGTITVKTKAGRGSIFTVTVPISKPQESRR